MINTKYVHKYKGKLIRQYRDKWGNIRVNLIPSDVTQHSVDDILKIMIDTGYSFIAAYFMYSYPEKLKTEDVRLIHVRKIKDKTNPSKISEDDIKDETQNIKRGSIIPIIIDKKYNIIKGNVTYRVLRRYRERYAPCIIMDNNENESKHNVNKTTRRQELYKQFDGKCYICGRLTHLDENEGDPDLLATIDHIRPVSRGGETTKENCALCCKMCNQLKNEFSYSPELKALILKELKNRNLM